MNILVLSSFLPYPLYSGGHVRLYNLLKILSQRHTMTLVCEVRDYQTEEDIQAMKKICKQVITAPRKKQWSYATIAKTGVTYYPFLMVGHTSKRMQETLRTLLKQETFDLIHIETFYVMQNVPKTAIPTVLVEHNIEYLVYQRFVQKASLFLRPLLAWDILKMKYWERKFWQESTKLVAVSERDKQEMRRSDVVVVPNGVDIERYRIKNSESRIKNKEKKILFIGDFRWVQNRDAVEFILKDIWPKITQNLELRTQNSLTLWIVGRNIPPSIKRLTNDKRVIFDENALDTTKIFEQADVLLAPIRVGGGTSFKILEAMASGVPVITTPLGVEGIDARDGNEVLIAKTASKFSQKLTEVLENKGLYDRIAKNARELIEEKYDWKTIANKLEEVYKSVVDSKFEYRNSKSETNSNVQKI